MDTTRTIFSASDLLDALSFLAPDESWELEDTDAKEIYDRANEIFEVQHAIYVKARDDWWKLWLEVDRSPKAAADSVVVAKLQELKSIERGSFEVFLRARALEEVCRTLPDVFEDGLRALTADDVSGSATVRNFLKLYTIAKGYTGFPGPELRGLADG